MDPPICPQDAAVEMFSSPVSLLLLVMDPIYQFLRQSTRGTVELSLATLILISVTDESATFTKNDLISKNKSITVQIYYLHIE